MRNAYRILATIIAVEVVIQAMAIVFAAAGEAKYIDDCGVIDKAAIESEDGDVRGARRKKVYRITPKGEQIFLELLQETPQDTQTEDARFRMRLAFFRYLPPETRIRLLERRRQALKERLVTIAESLRSGRGGTDDYGRALIEHNRSVTESDIAWLEQLIAAERTKSAPTGGLNRRRAALQVAPR